MFLKKNYKNLKKIKAGFVLSCLGDDKNYSLIHSPYKNTFADKVSKFNYKYNKYKFKSFSYLNRGSDERQYCSPKFNLPFCTLCRTKFGDYKEYHTSLDNLDFISSRALEKSFLMTKSLINIIEVNKTYTANIFGEPFLTKYNLKEEVSGYNKPLNLNTKTIIDLISYSNGKNDLIDISNYIKKDFKYLCEISKKNRKIKNYQINKLIMKLKNLGMLFENIATNNKKNCFVFNNNQSFSFEEVNRLSNKILNFLKKNQVDENDIVALEVYKKYLFSELYYCLSERRDCVQFY